MSKTILVVLLGTEAGEPVDLHQSLQRSEAQARGRAAGLDVEVACAPGFDHFRVVKKRLADHDHPVDAVVVEPASNTSLTLLLKDLRGQKGFMALNSWDPLVEESARRGWGPGLPFGTVSMDHKSIGRIQGAQLSRALPEKASVLVVTGPSRASAVQERLQGLKEAVRPDIRLHDAEAGQWGEAAGIVAFESWYGIFKSRHEVVHAIVGQSDDLAVGARSAATAVSNPEHAAMFGRALVFGVGACAGYGRDLVDRGRLHASVVAPPTAGTAIDLLARFWKDGTPIPLLTLNAASPYPPASVATA